MTKKRIYIVEDEGLIAEDLSNQLEKCGYEVTGVASSAGDALRQIDQDRPDLVLMDICLKGSMDGIEGADLVRTKFKIPVIFLTSHADEKTLERAKRSEPFGYIVKPFRQLNLPSTIEIALYKHEAEKQLQQRELWLRTVLESTPYPTIVTASDSTVLFMNLSAEALFETSSAIATGRIFREVAPLFQKEGDPYDPLCQAVLHQAATIIPRGTSLRTTANHEIQVQGDIAPCGASGEAVVTVRDISAQIKEEREARDEQKMLAIGRMAGGIAHDFNNLLTIILGYGEQLLSDARDTRTAAELTSIMDAGKTAAHITQQLLTLSRKEVAPVEVLVFNDLVRRVTDLVRSGLGTNIILRVNLQPAAGGIRVNPGQFDQVLINLLLNARDAMPNGGIITVTTGILERRIMTAAGELQQVLTKLVVADNGVGISPENQQHLFEPFYTTKPLGGGKGLSLAVVYGIVKEAHGEISVRSHLGEGTTFEVLLPQVSEVMTTKLVEPQQGATVDVGVKTILLVEDDKLILKLLYNFFKSKGYTVLQAQDGRSAIRLAECHEGAIDLLLTDVLLPGMDGPSLAIRLNEFRPTTKTLFISGYTSDASHFFRELPQSAEFMQKPFQLPKLLQKVRAMIAAQAG